MSKRGFRRTSEIAARYPILQHFETDRRRFLVGLGGLFGAGALAACGDRTIPAGSEGGVKPKPPDGGSPETMWGGAPPPPDARVDQSLSMGARALPDLGADSRVVFGDVAQPDARVDLSMTQGFAPQPDAGADSGCDDDSGSCPMP